MSSELCHESINGFYLACKISMMAASWRLVSSMASCCRSKRLVTIADTPSSLSTALVICNDESPLSVA
jgi:hypothetical protein